MLTLSEVKAKQLKAVDGVLFLRNILIFMCEHIVFCVSYRN
jgi:hypothetical protein